MANRADGLLPTPIADVPPPRKSFTRTEFEHLLETGFFDGQRFELIDGELLDKMGQKPLHATGVQIVYDWLFGVFGIGFLRIQLPMQAAGIDRERSVPEPDVAVLMERKNEFRQRHPRGGEVRLAVEVADTSASFDLSRKAQIYALAGVHEYWVLDLQRRRLVVHRQNGGERYSTIQSLSENDMASVEGHAESIRVGELLP